MRGRIIFAAMPEDPRSRSRLLIGLAALLSIVLASCSTSSPTPSKAKAAMDVAIDLGGQRIFYNGTALIPRGFNSPTPFKLEFDLAHWSHPADERIGFQTHKLLGDSFKKSGKYQPLANETGVISLSSGRVQLRGAVRDEGQELDGDWFLDGKKGGGFRIARKGYIFP